MRAPYLLPRIQTSTRNGAGRGLPSLRAGCFYKLFIAMTALLKTPAEIARKGVQRALQSLQEPGKASAVAASMGVSDSIISRLKTERMETERMEEVILLLAHLGLKVVPTEFKCVDRAAYEFLTTTHTRLMSKVPELIWESEE